MKTFEKEKLIFMRWFMRFIASFFYSIVKLYKTICFFFYLFDVKFGIISFIRVAFIFCGLFLFFYVFVGPHCKNNIYPMLHFTLISSFYVFVFEFLMYQNTVYQKLFSRKFVFSLTFVLLGYIGLTYFIQPAWCLCVLLNIFINFFCSNFFKSLDLYPNSFSISLHRYMLPFKLFVYFFSYIFTLFLYLLSIYNVFTGVDVCIHYLNKIVAFIRFIIF